MDKIQQIENAIAKAERRESNLTPLALSVPMLGSLNIRHLLNNFGSISENYLSVGVHVGGDYASAVCNNKLKKTFAVDSWASDEGSERKCEQEFFENSDLCKPPETDLTIIKSDCFATDISKIDAPIDFYSYDCGHSQSEQRQALTYFKPALADVFIYCCDDWDFKGVKEGTLEGIEEGGYEILFQKELLNPVPGDHLDQHWWNSYAVFLLKKKP